MERMIEAIIDAQGDVVIQTKGYVGAECQQASRFLEQAMGLVTADRKTTEFYQFESLHQNLRQ